MSAQPTYLPLKYAPYLIRTIIGINVFMFLISLLFSEKIITTLNPLFAFSPTIKSLKFLGAAGIDQIGWIEIWRSTIIANWLHGSFLHLLFNMLAIRTVGFLVIKEFGMLRMFSIFTLSGMAGFYLSYLGGVYLTIGASCGICGLIGAALYFGKSRGGMWGKLVYKQTSGWVLYLMIIGFLLPNINNWGHAGGLLGGIAAGWVFGYLEKRKEFFLDIFLAVCFAGITIFLLGQSVLTGLLWIYS